MGIILPAGFFFGGALMILLGILLWRRLWNSGSAQVDGECADVCSQTIAPVTGAENIRFRHIKRPLYLYSYQGKQYVAAPLFAFNRPGYEPVFGRCKLRIHPKHPEKVFSPARKPVGQVLILCGIFLIVAAALTATVLPI